MSPEAYAYATLWIEAKMLTWPILHMTTRTECR